MKAIVTRAEPGEFSLTSPKSGRGKLPPTLFPLQCRSSGKRCWDKKTNRWNGKKNNGLTLCEGNLFLVSTVNGSRPPTELGELSNSSDCSSSSNRNGTHLPNKWTEPDHGGHYQKPQQRGQTPLPTPICSHGSFRLQKTGPKYPALSTAVVGWGTNLPQHGGEKVTVLFWSQQRQIALVWTQKETAGQPSERQRCQLKVRRNSSRLPPTAASLSEITDATKTAQRWLHNKIRQKEVQAYYKKAKTTSRKN